MSASGKMNETLSDILSDMNDHAEDLSGLATLVERSAENIQRSPNIESVVYFLGRHLRATAERASNLATRIDVANLGLHQADGG